ncbi:MAG: nicotinate (nicotinamide) nucleotide adenylyltransferase [Gemmatimonadota bacterium]|nr:MAG: nicotinate (nicotinamide) nucleotide adenylyltransferase [Gemmatimonadota bacterium]
MAGPIRLGIFGGTFDPPHVGHLIVADDAAAALGLDRVLFVPTGEHPLKGSRVRTAAEVRLEMVRAATADHELFEVDGRELRRSGPSYTIETIEELAGENPGVELFLLIGSDILGEFDRWHRVDAIAKRARIAVLTRAEAEFSAPVAVKVELLRVEVTSIEISSSEVRERVASGRPYRYLVPESVYGIIQEHELYGKAKLKSARR